MPILTREDPRYYTLGHGGFLHRTGYAVSRLVVTKSDSGRWTFNISEISGSGIAAGVSNLYYPQQDRGWVKTYQIWIAEFASAGAAAVFKEFWPDINGKLFGNGKKAGSAAKKNP